MFQIGRFDPRAVEEQGAKAKKKRRKKSKVNTEDHHKDGSPKDKRRKKEKTSSLRVIAPETKGSISKERKLTAKANEEAFDDLDVADENNFFREEPDDDSVDDMEQNGEDYSSSQQKSPLEENEKEGLFDPTDELQCARHMSSLPLLKAAERWKLAPFLIQNLQADGYESFFPIQSLVLSDVLSTANGSNSGWQRDVCVAAPTGSGKTLAFVLPVLQTLWTRKVRRLRALCVLPSRDLANQVYQVFEHYSKGSDLRIGLAIGQANFQKEQEALIVGSGVDARSSTTRLAAFKSRLYPGNLRLALDKALEEADEQDELQDPSNSPLLTTSTARCVSAVDVLVCTPGRLVDHMDNTPGFSLEHLTFLIIDEADRLLSQSYHGWIGRVLDQAQQTSNKRNSVSIANPRRSTGTLQLRKWLYSATLTKDPQKLAALQLVHPKQFSMQTQPANSNSVYSMPPRLEEYSISCRAEQKPLVLVSLLMEFLQQQEYRENDRKKKNMVVVFTSSLESTHRLTRLLQLLWPSVFAESEDDISGDESEKVKVAECSSSLSQRQKSQLVHDCNDPESNRPRILVCSDGMSRGMDLEYVTLVVNYDVPGFAKTYVHRCGRTARAGKSGKAISLLKGKGQMGGFRKLRSLIANPERVQTYKCDTKLLTTDILQVYKNSLRQLGQVLSSEAEGELNPTDPI